MRRLTRSTQSLPRNPRPIHRSLIPFRSHGLRLVHITLILSLILTNFTALVPPALAAASSPAAGEPVESASDRDSGDLDPGKANGREASDRITEVNLAEAEAADTVAWQSAKLPALDAAGVSAYTGAATYRYSFWTPPGPGGLQPSLALSYSSQVADASTIQGQSTWVGLGWSLDTGYIERNMHGTYYDAEDDTFSVVSAGVNGLLLEGTDGYFHTADESFWRFKWVGDTWYAYDGSGNTYVFGETAAARAEYPYYKHETPTPDQCSQANGYDQEAQTYQWMLSRVTNKFGKSLTYTYTKETKVIDAPHCGAQITTTMAIYPDTIFYPDSATNSHYQVKFVLAKDASNQPKHFHDYFKTWEYSTSRHFYRTYRLDQVQILNDGRVVRQYQFGYTPIFPNYWWDEGSWGHSYGDNQSFAIRTINETGTTYRTYEGTGSNQVTLPSITFSYGDGMHLTSVENGYGAKVGFNYGGPGVAGENPWHESKASQAMENLHRCGTWKDADCINNNEVIDENSYLEINQDYFQPGGVYDLDVNITANAPLTVKVGLTYFIGSSPQTNWVEEVSLDDGEPYTVKKSLVVPPAATAAQIEVRCLHDDGCRVNNGAYALVHSRYRVLERSIEVPGRPVGIYKYSYHQWVYDRLSSATEGLSNRDEIRAALEAELNAIANELRNDPGLVNKP